MFSIEHSNLTETVRLTMTGTYTSPPCPPDNTHPLSARDLASFGQPTVGVFSVTLSQNSLFTQLTDIEQTLLQALCEPVALKAGQMLNPQASDTAAQVYFLTGATVALMVQGGPRSSLAVGLLGSDSAAGLEYALNASTPQLQFRVQTTGHAWGVKASVFRALMLQNPHMLGIVSHHLWQLVEHVATVAACIHTLDIRARLAAWLVLSAEKAQRILALARQRARADHHLSPELAPFPVAVVGGVVAKPQEDGQRQLRDIIAMLLNFSERNPGMTRVLIGDALVTGDIGTTLGLLVGGGAVAQFDRDSNSYDVILQVPMEKALAPLALGADIDAALRGNSGPLQPLLAQHQRMRAVAQLMAPQHHRPATGIELDLEFRVVTDTGSTRWVRCITSGSWRWIQPSRTSVCAGQMRCWISGSTCSVSPAATHSATKPAARLSVDTMPGRTGSPLRSTR